MAPRPFGILLTGGSSSRLGRDKAAIDVGGEVLAARVGRLLAMACDGAVEVGPGRSDLPALTEDPPGEGPLAAVVAGWRALVEAAGEKRPAVVVACDLPGLAHGMLEWLAARPDSGSVVPVVVEQAQPLCARWSVSDLEGAAARLAAGERSLRGVFGPDAAFCEEPEWEDAASPGELSDVDTPEDAARLALLPPVSGDDWVGLGRVPLPADVATAWATVPSCGAVVSFLGTVRDHAEGREGVEQLTYEAYERPALERMASVVAEARRRWPALGRVAALHRLGPLEVGETAVVVVVSSPHRALAFEAGEYVIDTVKEAVPIWKHERWRDGTGWGTGANPVRAV